MRTLPRDAAALLALVVFAPLAFGAVEPWSRAVLEVGALAGLALALRRRRRGPELLLREVPGALPLALLGAWSLAQAVPLPPAVVGLLSPRSLELWGASLGIEGPLPWVPLSLAPAETLREAARLGACAAGYALAVQALARGERLRAFLAGLAAFAGALAFVALVQAILAPDRLLLLRPTGARHPFGPYANRNHYANLMAMLAPLLAGHLLALPRGGGTGTARGRLVALLARREGGARVLAGLAASLTLASIVASLSRGGMLAAAAGLLAFGAGVLALRAGRGRAGAVLALAAGAAVFAGWFGWARVGERFSETLAEPALVDRARAAAWRDTLRIVRDFPLAGAGLGSFPALYPRYRSIPGAWSFSHAHNDYLELLAGVGAVGALLAAWFLAAVARAVTGTLRRRGDPAARRIAAGAAGGVTAFLVHGAGDFSLAIGANAFVFFVLVGVAVAASHARLDPGARAEPTLLPRRTAPRALAAVAVAAAGAVALVDGAGLGARLLRLRAEAQARAPGALGAAPAAARPFLAAAVRLAPLAPEGRLALASHEGRAGAWDAARAEARAALRLAPLDPEALETAGFAAAAVRAPAAGRYLAAAAAADPRTPRRRLALASWLLSRGERAAGTAALADGIGLDPAAVPAALATAALYRVPLAEVAARAPGRPDTLAALARAAAAAGESALAAQLRERAAAARDGERRPPVDGAPAAR